MIVFCNVFIFVFETIISYMYFNKKFNRKRNSYIVFICYLLSCCVQYIIHNFDMEYPIFVNNLAFLLCNFIIVFVCYKTKFIQALFNVFLLDGIMLTTEQVLMYFISAVLHVSLSEYTNNVTILFIETAATKALYFTVAYFVSNFNIGRKNKIVANDFSMSLFILPLISVLITVCLGQILMDINYETKIYYLFTGITVILLAVNIVVFLVHERVVMTLIQNTELKLEQQKNEINREYYSELECQYENSSILIHDIKKQLGVIKSFAEQKDCKRISQYIESIDDDYKLKHIRRYTTNKLLNVIVNRYADLCSQHQISFDVDIRELDISFVSDSNLTALIDNLLENAFEAAYKSTQKAISFSLDRKNENYIIFSVINSCDISPYNNELLITKKKSEGIHGYGLRSVKRVVKEYGGNLDLYYDEENSKFVAKAIIKCVDTFISI